MNQCEIAEILYESAKDTKQHIIQLNSATSFSADEFLHILESLVKIYHSLSLDKKILHLTEEFMNSRFDTQSETDVQLFQKQYLNILNHIIYESISYRKKYCIIQRNDPIPGLASHIITNLGQISLCLQEGYIPVIDMQFSNNMFSALSKESTENPWELFFKQPLPGTSVTAALSSHACAKKDGIPKFMPNYSMDCLSNPHLLDFWKNSMQQYMPFSDNLNNLIQSTLNDLPFENSKILGVLCRGTDYLSLRPYNHPCQPDCREIIDEATKIMERYQCEYCYLATEDEEIRRRFSESLGNKLITSQKMYFAHDQRAILSSVYGNDLSQLYNKNAEYLVSLYLLSQCNCLLSGRTSGLIVSLLLNQTPYEYIRIWNQGKYGIDDVATLQSLSIAPITK
nr:hypothetical protein [Lachnospiraceae bacterium]